MGQKHKSKSNNIRGRKGSQFRSELRGTDLERVLIVAIDAAKFYQKAMVCNYFGDVLVKPTFFGVNKKGISQLHEKIEHASKEVDAERIFVGIEATGHYYEDIVRELAALGYGVTIINAATTHEERSSSLNWTKTDDLDLKAIAQVIIQNKGTESKLPTGTHQELITLTRARRSEVRKRSRVKVEIRTLMDKIWREFQGHVIVNGHTPNKVELFSDFWGKSSLFFMENFPHPEDLLSMSEEDLRNLSIEHNLKLRDLTIKNLLYIAKESLCRPKRDVRAELLLLKLALPNFRNLNANIKVLDREIERILLETDGRLLLSIPGIGVTTAAEFYCEVGDVLAFEHAGQIIKKAGTNPIVIQSGGLEGFYGKISKQGNKNLRYVVYNIGKSLAQHNKDVRPYYENLRAKGKHQRKAYIALGNKFIRIAFAMLTNRTVYQTNDESYQYLRMMKAKLRHTKMSEFSRIISAA
ncbi:IS110 family transposase [Bacillaceae bacterium IKA-2]|nr:IS110 family transposase [Bacillaceae bacterium IKA-2]